MDKRNETPSSMSNGEYSPMLDVRQERYLQWLMVPEGHRTPPTQQAIAAEIGVDASTVRRWEKKPAFQAEWRKRVDELQNSPERTQRLLDALYEKGLNGDTRSAQLYLQATNRLAPTQVQISSTTNVAEISDEDLDKLIVSLASQEKTSRADLKAV